jgi:hypothetical protein
MDLDAVPIPLLDIPSRSTRWSCVARRYRSQRCLLIVSYRNSARNRYLGIQCDGH